MTPKEAAAAAKGKACIIRSCWNCNPAHEQLKKADQMILCYTCDHYFYKGVQLD